MDTDNNKNKEEKTLSAQPPVEHNGLGLGKVKNNAAGVPGVVAALQKVSEETGLIDGLRLLMQANQKDGFDCPSCAWPDPDGHRSKVAEYCENGAKAIADEATKRRVDPAFFKKYSVEHLLRQSDYWLNKQGRLTHPMYLPKGASHYEKIEWEDAFSLIADRLNSLPSPNDGIFYTSGRTSNEAAFMYQLFVRAFGTNNLPDCSNMCHESSGSGLSETVGIGKGSVTLEDLHECELMIIMGQNPGTNHPRMLSALEKCKKNGGVIVSVNPLPETGLKKFTHPQEVMSVVKGGTELSDHYLLIRINADVALLKAIMVLMLQAEKKSPGSVFDLDFIREHTEGFEALKADLEKQDLQALIAETGLERSEIEQVAELCIQKKKIIICWAMGLTQHKNGVMNIREVVNLLLLKGSIGKPGAGTCPVRGHSNVQGDRTMGIWEKPPSWLLTNLKKRFNFDPPQEHGFDVVEAIKSMHEEPGKVFFAMGGNFISATPDTEFTGQALQNCKLTVQVSTKLNRSHLITGEEALILPCLGRTEQDIQKSGAQFVSVENSMGVVHKSEGRRRPASDFLWSEPAIVAGMADAVLGSKSDINWEAMAGNYDIARNHIEACIPGFDNYNERVRVAGGFYLPNGARERSFKTDTGKAKFTLNEVPEHKLEDGQYLMMTIRSHDQFNTVIYGLDDRYRGIYNERRVVLMNPEDIEAEGFRERQAIDITSHFEGEKRVGVSFLVVPFQIPRGCAATYFPEANVLVPVGLSADKSNTPVSKSIVVSFEASKWS